jgi:hypothetical protein
MMNVNVICGGYAGIRKRITISVSELRIDQGALDFLRGSWSVANTWRSRSLSQYVLVKPRSFIDIATFVYWSVPDSVT